MKILIGILVVLFALSCARPVIEETEHKVVRPNVEPLPPGSVQPSVSYVQPSQPSVSYPTYVEPSQPSISYPTYVEPSQPVTPPVVVTPPPVIVTPTPSGDPDWTSQTIQSTGQSAVNPKFAGNPGQAQLMAKRGAIQDARRNLLEQVLGVKLNSSTTVRDMVAETDEINSETSGLIRQSRVTGEHFDGSIYTVNMELKLYDVYTYMKTQRIYYK